MREIKFRAWNGVNLEYNVMVGKFGAFYFNPLKGDGLDPNDSASLSTFNTIYSKETPIMQYTGLRDKNGVEIYEGDIAIQDGEIGAVVWYRPGARFYINQNTPILPNCEVIGNIYENPELLAMTPIQDTSKGGALPEPQQPKPLEQEKP